MICLYLLPPGGHPAALQLKKKGEQLDKLQDQLQEKSSAYSQAAVKIWDLEQGLLVSPHVMQGTRRL